VGLFPNLCTHTSEPKGPARSKRRRMVGLLARGIALACARLSAVLRLDAGVHMAKPLRLT
jgi:hypothetical protein